MIFGVPQVSTSYFPTVFFEVEVKVSVHSTVFVQLHVLSIPVGASRDLNTRVQYASETLEAVGNLLN